MWAIVPAAGKGSRMQQSEPKQYTLLNHKPIIEHSVSALLANRLVEQVLVCVAPDDQYWEDLTVAGMPRIEQTVGGETRAQSVLNGLNKLSKLADNNDWVLVHDAARPCLRASTLDKLVSELAEDTVGGILACRSSDTLKQASPDNSPTIVETLDRDVVWRAQTPQMFRIGLLRTALSDALNNNLNVTDEASAMESAGHSVRLIEGDADNIKVTTQGDLALAEFLLSNL